MMISPTTSATVLDVFQSATASNRTAPARPTSTDAVTVDSLPASPPAEVLAEMRTAAAAAERLAGDGRSVRFSNDPQTGRVTAAITDADGNVTSTLSLRDVLAVAGGANLP